MNKSQLITAMSQKANIPLPEAKAVINTILDTMIETMSQGNNIEIRGFGSFVVKSYDSYYGRNPKTGEKIKVAPKKLPFFKVGKELKDMTNSGV